MLLIDPIGNSRGINYNALQPAAASVPSSRIADALSCPVFAMSAAEGENARGFLENPLLSAVSGSHWRKDKSHGCCYVFLDIGCREEAKVFW